MEHFQDFVAYNLIVAWSFGGRISEEFGKGFLFNFMDAVVIKPN